MSRKYAFEFLNGKGVMTLDAAADLPMSDRGLQKLFEDLELSCHETKGRAGVVYRTRPMEAGTPHVIEVGTFVIESGESDKSELTITTLNAV